MNLGLDAGSAHLLRVELLGPVRAWRGDHSLDLGTPQQQAVFGALATRAGRAVSHHELIDAVWGENAPVTAHSAVYTYIARLRRVLEPGRPRRAPAHLLSSEGPGYLLRLTPGQLDAEVFGQHLASARRLLAAGEPAGAVAAFDAALRMCRGTPWAGIPGPFAEAERDRLGEQCVAAIEDRAQAMITVGRHAAVVAELTRLRHEHPYRERQAALLMLALCRDGRQVEALAVYRETRRKLIEELGIEPGPELRELHGWILVGSPAVWLAATSPPVTPRQLPRDVASFTGRQEELRAITAAGEPGAGGAVTIAAIHGLAGAGKSALAIHAAHLLAPRFPDGQLYLDLRGTMPGAAPLAPLAALETLLRGVGVPAGEIPADPDAAGARWRTAVAGQRLLLVLDNATGSSQVLPLLPGSATCHVLVSSRRALTGIGDAAHLYLGVLPPAEAVEMLTHLIGQRRAAGDPAALADIARWCGCLPLALRLAGGRLCRRPGWPLRLLAGRLAGAGRLDELSDDQTGVRASLALCHAELASSGDERDMLAAQSFRLLGPVEAGEVSVMTAARLFALPPRAAEHVLDRLADAGLLQSAGYGWYLLHEVVGLYARELALPDLPEPAGRQAAAGGGQSGAVPRHGPPCPGMQAVRGMWAACR